MKDPSVSRVRVWWNRFADLNGITLRGIPSLRRLTDRFDVVYVSQEAYLTEGFLPEVLWTVINSRRIGKLKELPPNCEALSDRRGVSFSYGGCTHSRKRYTRRVKLFQTRYFRESKRSDRAGPSGRVSPYIRHRTVFYWLCYVRWLGFTQHTAGRLAYCSVFLP